MLVGLAAVGCGGTNDPPPVLSGPGCGNAVLEAGEECDDGNLGNDDGCLVSCYRPARFVASDPHVHSRGCETFITSPGELVRLLGNEGIDVGAALVWGVGFGDDQRLFTGSDDPASGGGRILHYDLEVSAFAAGVSGHLVVLGLRDLGFSPDPFRSPKTGLGIPPWARAQGERVAVGMAHGQFWPPAGFPNPPVACCMPWEFPIQAVRGGASFLITERRGDGPPIDAGTFLLWRTLLNSGFRIAILGASDYPCIHRTVDDTSPRTDVLVDGALTYDSWLAGVRQGRAVVTLDARNHLNLRVNGVPMGGEAQARSGEVLLVSIESRSPTPTAVELLVNGEVATTLTLGSGSQVATLRLGLGQSSWVAARTRRAATNAVYVTVDGKPIRASAADTCYLVRYANHLSALVADGAVDLAEDTDEALAGYAAARTELEKRFLEAGGQACF